VVGKGDLSVHKGLLESNKTAEEQALCRAAFRSILSGEPIGRDGLATALGFEVDRVAALLDGLAAKGMIVTESGSDRVVGSWGLSFVPTAHRLQIRGRELFAWCALDAVGIPAGLGEDASADSKCYMCASALRVELTAGQIKHAHPAGIHLWLTGWQAGRSLVGFT
jgi:alkylmercury lyase